MSPHRHRYPQILSKHVKLFKQPHPLPALLAAIALLHGLLYVWLLPPWQAPDEPMKFEYAALIDRLNRVPAPIDTDPAVERRIVESLARQRFFEYLLNQPAPPLTKLADVQAHFFMPRQVGGDPPLYFILAAIPIRLLGSHPIEDQLLSMRLLGLIWLIGTVVCAYGAARALIEARGFALAVGLLVALQPMFVFIGVAGGNDGLANLIGAAICWALIKAIRGSYRRRWWLLALLILLILGLLTKRNLLPFVAVLILLGCGWAIVYLLRAPHVSGVRITLSGLLLLGLALGVGGVPIRGQIANGAADWYSADENNLAVRVAHAPGSNRAALELKPGQIALQALPDVATELTQAGKLRVSARIWMASGAGHGRLQIDTGVVSAEVPFNVDIRAQIVRLQLSVPQYCPYVHVIVYADNGTIYADQIEAKSAHQPNLNLLSNDNLAEIGLQPGSIADRIAHYLHFRDIEWAWRSGRLLGPLPHGWELVRIFFVSFWGQFGWMSVPLVGETPWECTLVLLCIGGLLGIFVWLAQLHQSSTQRDAVAMLLLIVLVGLLFPLLNAYIQPRDQVLQQGRYLFPALVPVVLLLVLGWRTLVPSRWRFRALVVWSVFWLAFAAAAQQLIFRAYHY